MTPPPAALLLDTHAAIWFTEGKLRPETVTLLVPAGKARAIFVSPVSMWEIGMLARRRGDRPSRVQFDPNPERWMANLLAKPAIVEAPFTASMAFAASFLPGELHDDPADRLLVATARELGLPIVTRDHRILAYAEAGHVAAIAC